jgi:hypothetical protein
MQSSSLTLLSFRDGVLAGLLLLKIVIVIHSSAGPESIERELLPDLPQFSR